MLRRNTGKSVRSGTLDRSNSGGITTHLGVNSPNRVSPIGGPAMQLLHVHAPGRTRSANRTAWRPACLAA